MCAVSMIADHYTDKWRKQAWPVQLPQVIQPGPSQAEFDALRREVADLKELLLKAKAHDAATGQPDCEMAEKVALLKTIAEFVGVDLRDVFGSQPVES